MKNIKNKIVLIALISLNLLPTLALAAVGGITPVPPPEEINIFNIMVTILNWAFGLLLVIAAGFIMYAAFLYLTAAGDEEKLKLAKNLILYAVVAIIVAFVARGIVAIVRGLLGI